jgi:hypothetical protein
MVQEDGRLVQVEGVLHMKGEEVGHMRVEEVDHMMEMVAHRLALEGYNQAWVNGRLSSHQISPPVLLH